MTASANRTSQSIWNTPILFVAFELGLKEWKLAFATEFGEKPRLRRIPARSIQHLERELSSAKVHWGLPQATRVVSCYEAGRDGFWLHRFLTHLGVENRIVDPASIEVKRRRRRAKTDRLDAEKLVSHLMRHELGDDRVWSVVRVPSVEEEDDRHLGRELQMLKRDRTRHRNRIHGLLMNQGLQVPIDRGFLARLERLRSWDTQKLGTGLRARLRREYERLSFLESQIRRVEAERRRLFRESTAQSVEKVRQLFGLKGVGINSSWVYVMELFAWRSFRNRRQLGALVGLVPSPHESGEERREQGMSKAGNRHVRALAIELAWCWLRFQPDSALSQWYEWRFGRGSKRLRKIGIVALARKLLIALWKYLETGVLPEGAMLKETIRPNF